MAMLEVAALAPQLGAEEDARPLRIAEAGDELVAVRRGEVSDVGQGFDAGLAAFGSAELGAEVLDGLARLGEDEHLLAREWAVEKLAEGAQLGVALGRNRGGPLRQCRERGVRRTLQAGGERRRGAGKAAEEGGEHGAGKPGGGGGGADLALQFPLAGVRSDRDLGEDARGETSHHGAAVAQEPRGEPVAALEVAEEILAFEPGKLRVVRKELPDAYRGSGISGEEGAHFGREVPPPG